MTREEIGRLKDAMDFWARHHPEKDKPFLHIAGSSFSPLELAAAVREENQIGRFQINVFEYAMAIREESFGGIIEDLEKPQRSPNQEH